MSPFKVVIVASLLALPSVGQTATYYVAKTGSNSHSCAIAQNRATPKASIQAALACVGNGPSVGAGHTVVVQAGIYDEELYNVIPGGTSWATPFTLKAEERGKVTLRPTKGPCGQPCAVVTIDSSPYVVIDGFIMDASNNLYSAVKLYSNYIRLQYSEIYNPYYSCILSEGSYGEFLHLVIHACGKRNPEYHLGQGGANDVYLSGNHNEVAYTHLYDGSAGIAFWHDVQNPSYNVAHHNLIERGFETGGLGMYKGVGNKAYNNVVKGAAIEVGWNCKGCAILNNTIYNTQGAGNYAWGIHVDATVSQTLVKNNIIWRAQGGPILNESSTTSQSNNLTDDPLFVDAPAGNFKLKPSSPAIDAGLSLLAEGVKDDFLGMPRPQDRGYDIGAYEYTASGDTDPPSPPQGVRVH